MQRLTESLDFQSQALVLRAERQRLIASNIANADTPGYVARDMDFARALREATGDAAQGLGRGAAGGVPPGANALTAAGPGHAGWAAAGLTAGNLTAGNLTAGNHPAHLPLQSSARDEPGLLYASHAQNSIDRNTVDLDRERHSFADNAVKYEATLRFINGSVRSMLDAMKSHNQ